MDQKAIQLTSITKRFGAIVALDGVSAAFEGGKLYVIAGPNGAGKSTLLRIIAGLMRPTAGEVSMDESTQRQMGVMMQESYLYSDLTVRENLALYTKLYRAPKARVKGVVDLLDLGGFLDHEVAALSHGQKQRASLARTLLPEPTVLLLDEPFLGLDAESVERVQRFLVTYKRDGGRALIATHELMIVKDLADDLLRLKRGKVEYFGGWVD